MSENSKIDTCKTQNVNSSLCFTIIYFFLCPKKRKPNLGDVIKRKVKDVYTLQVLSSSKYKYTYTCVHFLKVLSMHVVAKSTLGRVTCASGR